MRRKNSFEVCMKKIILIILLLNAYSGFANSERDKSSNTEALNTFQKQHIYALNKRIDEIKDNEIREQLRLEIEKTADKKNCYCLNPQSSDFENCIKIEDQNGISSEVRNAKLAEFTAKCPAPQVNENNDPAALGLSKALESDLNGLTPGNLGVPIVDNQKRKSSVQKIHETNDSSTKVEHSDTAPK